MAFRFAYNVTDTASHGHVWFCLNDYLPSHGAEEEFSLLLLVDISLIMLTVVLVTLKVYIYILHNTSNVYFNEENQNIL